MSAATGMPKLRVGSVGAWLLLILFETTAQLSLRIGGEALSSVPMGLDWVLKAVTNPWVILGAVAYLLAFAAWMVILDKVSLGFGFPATALVIVVVTLSSWLLLGESLSPQRCLGIAIVLIGLVVMGGDDP